MKLFKTILFLLVLNNSQLFAQLKFKPQLEGAAGFQKENFFLANYGLGVEKKIDIDKSIETGIYYHTFGFNFGKDQYGFYDAFIKNSPNNKYVDSITNYRAVFNFVSIPVGFNYYLTPKTYIGYKIGFNFFSSSNYKGIFISPGKDSSEVTVFKAKFDNDIFKKSYINQTISINTIVLRRIDFGLSFIYTKSDFFKSQQNDIYKSFNKEVSKYFAIGFSMKIFVFQIDSKKI